jgi:hypothetical protein
MLIVQVHVHVKPEWIADFIQTVGCGHANRPLP